MADPIPPRDRVEGPLLISGIDGPIEYSNLEIVHHGPGPAVMIMNCRITAVSWSNVVVRHTHPDSLGVVVANNEFVGCGEHGIPLMFMWDGLTVIGPGVGTDG